MSCINCNTVFTIKKNTTRYHSPNQLTHKLQDQKWKPGSLKPDLTILGALEDISDGDVSLERLQPHSAQYICHECQAYLRQAVNKKAEVESHMQELCDKVTKTSELERRKYYRENYGKDRQGRCWSCFYQFKPEDYQKSRSNRLNFTAPVVEGMSVSEAVSSLFEDKRDTLDALLEKKTFICKPCMALLRNVIKTQCIFDTYLTCFNTQTHKDSVYARLCQGEDVPCTAQILEEFEDADVGENIANSLDNEFPSTVTSIKQEMKKGKKRPFHKTLGNAPVVKLSNSGCVKRMKRQTVNKESDKDGEDEDLEGVNDSDIDNLDEQNDIVTENEKHDCYNPETEDFEYCGGLENENELKIKKADKDIMKLQESKVEVKVKPGEILKQKSGPASKDLESMNEEKSPMKATHELISGGNKKKMQIRVNLSGSGKILAQRADSQDQREPIKRDMSDEWVLYYYPKCAGRAEFVRLLFEEAAVPYKNSVEDGPQLRSLIIHGEMEGYPHFAPPMIRKGNFQLSQTPVICRYLGELFGLCPENIEDKLHAEQVNQSCHDFIAEGRLAFHGVHNTASYFTQQEGTQPYIDRFKSERLPRWLKYFERVLKANKEGKGYLFGDSISYADLALYHILHATEAQFPDVYQAASFMPLLKHFKQRIESRPRIAAYLKSSRWLGFSGNSMM